jgi:hypothetical protein
MALVRLNHPTDDPALPSFVHPLLLEVMDDLETTLDCWNGLKGAKEKYLPKEPREPKKAYEGRLMRSSFNSFFRDAINAFAGVLSRYELTDAPPSFQQHLNNIDGQGNSLRSFLMKADTWTMRDGGSLLLADMPPAPEEGATRADTRDRRPYLSLVNRRNLVNFEPLPGGQARALTILEVQEKRVGLFGVEYVPRFRVMRDGMWAVYDVIGEGKVWTATVAQYDDGRPMAGVFRAASGAELSAPPVRWYSGTNEGFGQGDIGLLPLANYALDHFREYSDLKELLHKTAIPVPVREGVLGTGPGNSTPPMVLGSNSGIDLPAGGKFHFAEVTGAALGKHEEHLVHIENLIDRKTLAFLFSGAQKTATQANLESVQMQATLQSIGEAKVSVVQSLMELWCQFSGETLAPTAGIELAEGIFDEPLTVEKLGLAERLYDRDLLSRRTVLYLQQKMGLLPPGQTIDKELESIAADEPEPPAPIGINDLEDGDEDL